MRYSITALRYRLARNTLRYLPLPRIPFLSLPVSSPLVCKGESRGNQLLEATVVQYTCTIWFSRALRDVLNIITGCHSIVPHHDAFGTNDNKGRTLVTKPATDFRFNLPACNRWSLLPLSFSCTKVNDLFFSSLKLFARTFAVFK